MAFILRFHEDLACLYNVRVGQPSPSLAGTLSVMEAGLFYCIAAWFIFFFVAMLID